MGWSFSFLLLLLLLSPGPGAPFSLLRYRYDCGDYGMQLLAYPTRGRTVRFSVVDEFGTRFDVANCSICLHWLNAGADGAIIFSSGYEGCHVLVKEDRYVLRVQLEEMLLSGVLAASYEVNMTCPQLGGYETLTDGNTHAKDQASQGNSIHHTQADVLVPLSQPGLLHHVSQSALTHPGPQAHSEQVHTVARTQPVLVHPGLQPQPGMGHPVTQLQQGLIRPGRQPQNHPGLVHLGAQTQPGLRPGLVPQNHPGAQTQPGLLHQGVQPQNHPGLVHSGAQIQQGLHRPGLVPQNQSGLPLRGTQPQPGLLRPGLVPQNHPGVQSGLTHAGAQPQAGFVRPAAQPQSQLGLSRPSLHSQSQTGLLRPVLQSQAGLVPPGHPRPALAHPGLQSRPGLQPQAQPGLLRPGLQSQPSLLQSTALFYPSAGAGNQGGGMEGGSWAGSSLSLEQHPLTREQCQVAVGRMPCVAPQGREPCLQAGCCYDDMDRIAPCYYGNTATVQCLLDGHFVLVVPRGLATQPYNLDSVRLASSQPGCEPLHVTETFVMFRFPVTQCGTTVQVIEDRLIYENQLISTIDVQGSPRGSITRDSIYILQARCIYNASDLLPLRMEVAVPPTTSPLAVMGPLGLQLRIATDESYSSYHPDGDHPLVRVLRDPIYVEVRLLQKTDPNLVLVLHHCWASPSTDATAEPQWPILVDGCPFTGDNYRTQLVPVGPASPQLPFPSHYQRFVISTFTFVEPPTMAVLEGEVYISCSASVCHLAQPEPCRPSCQLGVPARARRSLGDKGTADAVGTVTSQGRIVFPKVPKVG
ncbi:ZP1 protein, partial [Nyctibius grandis]|nr:ZP1 protein [Nyctibius grandis]